VFAVRLLTEMLFALNIGVVNPPSALSIPPTVKLPVTRVRPKK
jgi:hypothetical protein